MRVRLVHITTRRSGAKSRREERLEVESLSVGRGTDTGLSLNGLTISLHHATFQQRTDGIYIVKDDAQDLRVNGQLTNDEKLESGDSVRVGQFELRVLSPENDEDLALEVEERVRRGDERQELGKRLRLGVERGLLTRRKLAWSLVATILVVFLAIPLLSGRFEGAWNSGSISRKHAFIADECSACHERFARVSNDGCLGCHRGIENHTSVEASPAALEGARCASCHVEHNGSAGLAEIDQTLCEECHADLAAVYASTALADASDFGDRHPEFRLFVVSNPGSGEREPAVWSPELRERSGVRFSHLLHVGDVLPHPDGRWLRLRCDECHHPDAGGMKMQPISFEKHCATCHVLNFDEDFEGVEALHGDPVRMRENLRGLYSERALKGEVKKADAPPAVRFARPGQKFTAAQAEIVFRWVEKQVREAEEHLMHDPGECALCHELMPGSAADAGTGVAPVEIASVWMPKSEFRHTTHSPFPCGDCHAAAAVYDPDAGDEGGRPGWSLPGAGPYALRTPDELRAETGLEPSQVATDVLLPGLDTCRGCHGGAGAGPPKVASDCVLCHPFHREEHGPMRIRSAVVESGGQIGLPLD